MDTRAGSIAKRLPHDISENASMDNLALDALVNRCVSTAEEAITRRPFAGFSEAALPHLRGVVSGFRHSHLAIRAITSMERGPWAVDAFPIARVQVEALFTMCAFFDRPSSLWLFLKAGWKKIYIQFLISRIETQRFPRWTSHNEESGLNGLQMMADSIGVTDAERKWLEWYEMCGSEESKPEKVEIAEWFTPGDVVDLLGNSQTREMLKRFILEYRYLSSFSHGGSEGTSLRAMVDSRSPLRHTISEEKADYVYRHRVCEPALFYSAISTLQACTELAVLLPAEIDLWVAVSNGWDLLTQNSLLAIDLYRRRAKRALHHLQEP